MSSTWAALFDRAADRETSLSAIRETLERVRESEEVAPDDGTDHGRDGDPRESTAPDRPNPARIVADADVLAADLLVGGAARAALDHVRRHSWVELVASDVLLAETERVVATLSNADLAADHRARLEEERVAVEHPEGDHPALASAYRGGAAHVLAYDDALTSAEAGMALQPRVDVSVRPPDAFARLFDPESLHDAVEGGSYPGPDRDPGE